MPDARSSPLDEDEHPKHRRRDDHVPAEQSGDPVGEQLVEEEAKVKAVLDEERNELRVWERRSQDAEGDVRVFRSHGDAGETIEGYSSAYSEESSCRCRATGLGSHQRAAGSQYSLSFPRKR